MNKIRTHYDNLKVARDAPPAVIRAAYKALAQKYHPDRNSGNAKSARIMVIINASYEVLSNPDKRLEHDLWIKKQEKESVDRGVKTSTPPPQAAQHTPTEKDAPPPQAAQHTPTEKDAPTRSQSKTNSGGLIAHIFRNWGRYGVVIFVIWALATDKPSGPNKKPIVETDWAPAAAPAGQADEQDRQLQAVPEGSYYEIDCDSLSELLQAVPEGSFYNQKTCDHLLLHANGDSTIVIDSQQNDFRVQGSLEAVYGSKAYQVRQFYIPPYGRLTLDKVAVGNYNINYTDIDNGGSGTTGVFSLKEKTKPGITVIVK